MAEEKIVRYIDGKYVVMKPGESKGKNLLSRCEGCIFDGMIGCSEAYDMHQVLGFAYCVHHESVWRIHVLDNEKSKRRKLFLK